jgi:hypothetical protein
LNAPVNSGNSFIEYFDVVSSFASQDDVDYCSNIWNTHEKEKKPVLTGTIRGAGCAPLKLLMENPNENSVDYHHNFDQPDVIYRMKAK